MGLCILARIYIVANNLTNVTTYSELSQARPHRFPKTGCECHVCSGRIPEERYVPVENAYEYAKEVSREEIERGNLVTRYITLNYKKPRLPTFAEKMEVARILDASPEQILCPVKDGMVTMILVRRFTWSKAYKESWHFDLYRHVFNFCNTAQILNSCNTLPDLLPCRSSL